MSRERAEIIESADCGNSPKNAFVQTIAIALETGEADPESFAPTVTWDTSATGETIMANGHRRRFSHVLTFTNNKATTVATLKSFS